MKDQLKALGFKSTTDELVAHLLKELEELSPYIYHTSTNNTIYIKFKEAGCNSLRIADHDSIEKYRYMWNLRLDFNNTSPFKVQDGEVTRYFYTTKCLDELVEDIMIFWACKDRPFCSYGKGMK